MKEQSAGTRAMIKHGRAIGASSRVSNLATTMYKGVMSAEGARELARQGRMGVELPESVLKLTEGYELRVYYFEILECIRKLALTGMPVWFEMGSVTQLTFGLIVCFFSFGAYMMLAPYTKNHDDQLAQICQTQTFIALISAVVLEHGNPDAFINRNMGTLLIVLTILPIVFAIYMEIRSVGEDIDDPSIFSNALINKLGEHLKKKRDERGRRQRAKERGEVVFEQAKQREETMRRLEVSTKPPRALMRLQTILRIRRLGRVQPSNALGGSPNRQGHDSDLVRLPPPPLRVVATQEHD